MTMVTMGACLNCGAALHGRFCAECGQRDIPPYPTVREMIGDAWHELVGWDGRLAMTFRTLARYPGALTLDSMEGKRSRYVRPLRLYLAVSVVYFMIKLFVPTVGVPSNGAVVPGERNVKVDVLTGEGMEALTPEDRAQITKNLEDAPWWVKPFIERFLEDPAGVRRRLVENMPRAFFILVPAFAGILALLFRRRRYLLHLIFSLHLFAVAFFALSFGELAKFSHSLTVTATVQVAAWLWILGYALLAVRKVYQEPWLRTLVKAAALVVLYMMVWIPVMVALMAWAVLLK